MRLFLASLLTVGFCCSAAAQAPDGSTDNELYAAYCSGALSVIIDQFKPGPKPTLEEAAKKYGADDQQGLQALYSLDLRDWQRDVDSWNNNVNRRKRFTSYLLSTGVLTNSNRKDAVFGIAIAQNRGQTEEKQCFATIDRCAGIFQGSGSFESKTQEAFKCVEADCSQVQRCLKPDALPF